MSNARIADISTAVVLPRGSEPTGVVPALTIAAHPAAHRVGDRALLTALAVGKEVAVSRNGPDFAGVGRTLGAPLGDPFVSRKPIALTALADGAIRIAVAAGGTPISAPAPIHTSLVVSADELARGVPLALADRVVLVLHLADAEPTTDAADAMAMIGDGAAIRRVRGAIARISDLAVPVLIRGETGTGKELVARAVHDRGPQRGGPFVSVNLGALPRELAAAELFGAVKGAYTGATRDRDGLFRAARGGTLLLDEVGEAPPEIQAMLLRVLETGELYPVGGDRPLRAEVRLIAATDANLEDHIARGSFKAPLLHRLAGYEIRLPPLRERREDIGALFYHFAHQDLAAIGEDARLAPSDAYAKPWLPAQLAMQLIGHAWPGNVRELRNATRQIVIGSRGLAQARLEPQLAAQLGLPPANAALGSQPAMRAIAARGAPGEAARRKASEIAEPELLAALRSCTWDLKAAADRLGISRPSIYDLIARSPNIRTAGDLSADEITRSFARCGGDLDAMVAELQVSGRALSRRIRELGLDD